MVFDSWSVLAELHLLQETVLLCGVPSYCCFCIPRALGLQGPIMWNEALEGDRTGATTVLLSMQLVPIPTQWLSLCTAYILDLPLLKSERANARFWCIVLLCLRRTNGSFSFLLTCWVLRATWRRLPLVAPFAFSWFFLVFKWACFAIKPATFVMSFTMSFFSLWHRLLDKIDSLFIRKELFKAWRLAPASASLAAVSLNIEYPAFWSGYDFELTWKLCIVLPLAKNCGAWLKFYCDLFGANLIELFCWFCWKLEIAFRFF